MSLHRFMLIVILFAGFGLGLGLPWLHRHTDENHAREALQTARTLAQAEQTFFEKNGYYTADFVSLLPQTKCTETVIDGQSALACPGYTFQLKEAQQLWVQSIKYPQWFTVSLDKGSVTCQFEEGSFVGPKLCTAAHVPNYI